MTKLVVTSMTRSGHNYIKNNLISWKKYDDFLNLESENPKNHQVNMNRYKISVNDDNIIIVRDLLNWLSSYLKMLLNEKIAKKRIELAYDYTSRWERITMEAFNETKFINNKIIINYDDFCSSQEYRKNICEKINGKYNENKLNVVPNNGQYSSFDGKIFQNIGNKMKTNERYKFFIGHEYEEIYFNILKKHPEAIRLYEKYFILNNEQKELINF